ncbi:MAG: tRNA (guanosine(37)-N1)-methyltransferase TrmD [Clostridiales bacterium]|nr:tRNA (guanosine(37)-N1)-methyltransferase TrmD [Clostridiales bacterium]
MRFDVMTLFPDMITGGLGQSMIGRAIAQGTISLYTHNIRDFSADKFRRVDDTPYGGGKGMLMCCQPIYDCYQHIVQAADQKPYVIYASPQGRTFDQQTAKRLAEQQEHIAILCGHYEGVDRRIVDEIVDEEISIGDYVLTGGELPACVMIDAIARMLPGVLSDAACYENESFYHGLLEEPQYTKPAVFRDRAVPEVLLSGDHAKINRWRHEAALALTLLNRPDLIK